MAAVIMAEMARGPLEPVLALVGNAHAATSPSDVDAASRPTGPRLRVAGLDVVSVLGVPSGGTFWGVTEPFGSGSVQQLGEMAFQPLADRYDLAVEIGPVSAALPVG